MKLEQRRWTHPEGWTQEPNSALGETAELVLLFGATHILKEQTLSKQINEFWPNAHILGCSTAGEICGTRVMEDSVVATAICFEHTEIKGGQIQLKEGETSFQAGERLAKLLDKERLVHVLVLSDGLAINGSDLVRGLTRHLPEYVTLTGGLAGDGNRFSETFVFFDSAPITNSIAVLGFYGGRLKIGYGSMGGWDPFGPERLITRSEGNVLYEFDGHSALELYKKYLGAHSKGLPATGLLFPLSIRKNSSERGVVRTILSIDEDEQSMTFAGDVPEGAYARLMKANFDRLIDGATGAAKACIKAGGSNSSDLAILISCVGRKLVLKQRVEEEVEAVQHILGNCTTMTGFYSYGEICPFVSGAKCELHNQTITITTFSEE